MSPRCRVSVVVFALALSAAGCSTSDNTQHETGPANTELDVSVPADDSTTVPPERPSTSTTLATVAAGLTADHVEEFLDSVPVNVRDTDPPFAGWNFDSSGQAVISFKGAVPSEMIVALKESPWVDAIQLRGGETCSLADLLDHVSGGLHVLGAMDGSGGYDANLRRHVVQVVMDPSRPELTGVALFEALNDEIVKVGGRELTEWEIEIEELGPEFLDPSLTLASEEQPPRTFPDVAELCGYEGSN